MEPLAYTIAEAMQVAKVGRTLLFERIAAGELPVTRIGRRTLIPADGLKAWLASHTSPAPALRPPAAGPVTAQPLRCRRRARRAYEGAE